ncbi:MAG: hypothetical protein KatS3mg028_0028 [Bacteroidia bacterium]|nr:MAG: hypothetical protein KatS3mg028_0028 [Bacteroidia bacterium]
MNKHLLIRELLIAARQTKKTPQKAEHYFSTGAIVLDVCDREYRHQDLPLPAPIPVLW